MNSDVICNIGTSGNFFGVRLYCNSPVLPSFCVLQFVKDNAETIKITLATVAALYTAWVYYIEMRTTE